MIGTTSDMESNADILFPSISICSAIRGGYDVPSINHNSVNLSNTFIKLQIYVRNFNGDIQSIVLEPNKVEGESRDKILS